MEIRALTFFPRHTRITVRFPHHLYSSQVPDLAANLLKLLPSLREHRCINRSGLAFTEEVQDTELGHVFEHVLLAILHGRGFHLRGQTTWNWHRDPLGTYQVTINSGKKLVIKESLLIAQAIFTNALVGPVLAINLPKLTGPDGRLPLQITPKSAKEPKRLLFSAAPETN